MAKSSGTLGLKVLFEGPKPCVDIVAVHGLGASPDWAWIRKVEDGDEEVHVNWLADKNMLPAKLPDSRIMTFNYESKWFLRAPKQRRPLCAIQLLTALDNQRKEEKDTKHRPLIFIGHSFGGVVVEQSLVSANSHGGNFQYLASSTVGVIFLGTPHRGTPAAKWGEVVAKSAKALGFGSEDSILKDLRADSESSRDLLYEFALWANRAQLKIVSFFEQHETDYGKRVIGTWKELNLGKVVSETSACIDGYRKVPLSTDHLKINKYSGPDDPSYIVVSPLIVDMTQNAVQTVQGRLNPQTIVEDNSRIPKENLSCLQCLFLSNPQDDLAAIRSAKGERVAGTCEWILAQNKYTSWLVADSPQLLWLSGGPGIGKTMISSFLVKELAQLAERSSQMTLAYYFCDDKDEKRKTATAILRGLLLQLLRQRPVLFKHIQTQFDMSRDSLFTNFHALWRVFISIVRDPEAGEVCCLIDALDECEKESRQLFLTDFTKLFHPQQSKKTFVKFIVTSRREKDIEWELLSADKPSIQDLHVDTGNVNGDLSKFISVKVDELSKSRRFKSKDTKREIELALTRKAGGTFLYVSLVLNELKRTPESQIQEKLQEWPSEIDKIYDKILSQIEAGCGEIVKSVLSWVAVARRPLTTRELASARLAGSKNWKADTISSEDLDRLENDWEWCGSFIYVHKTNGTVNLVHQSAKDFLLGRHLQQNVNLSQYHVVADRTNLLMFRTCWAYLSLEELQQGNVLIERHDGRLYSTDSHRYPKGQPIRRFANKLLDEHCFLRYAIQEWLKHALAANPALATEYTLEKDNLDKLPTLRDTWLLRAANEGQEVVIQQLLENGAELESKDEWGQTPLSRAAMKGHETVVKVFLSRDNVAVNTQAEDGRTPLSYAAENGHEAVVKLLLSREDIAVNSRDKDDQTPLSYAAENGYDTIVKLLLSREDIAVNNQDQDDRTPLSYAAKYRHEAVVKLLLSREDITVNSRDEDGQTPLSYAAENGHEAVVELLLSRDDVAVNSQDRWNWTPLLCAVERGHEAVVKLLLSREDIAVNTQDQDDRTPLSYAAKNGHEAVVKLLLSRDDVAVNSQDWVGRTPLLYAAGNGHEAVVKLLLSREDIAVNSQDRWNWTPLLCAVERGHEAVVKLLLSRDDIAINSRNERDRTPLLWAAENGHEAVVKLLLSRDDVAVNSQDWVGRTPLLYAAGNGHEAVVKLLLSREDIAINSQDRWGRTPLSWAANNGHEAVVKLLLSRDDVAVNSRDEDDRTPLLLAAKNGHETVVKLLEQKMGEVSHRPKRSG